MPLPRYGSCTRCPRVKGPLSPPIFLNQSVLIVLRLPVGFIRIADPSQITITFLYDMVISRITRQIYSLLRVIFQIKEFRFVTNVIDKLIRAFADHKGAARR